MGNSGSMNGLPGYDDATAYHHPGYHHQYQRYHEMMRANGGSSGQAPAWLESYQRDLRNGRATFDNRHHHHDTGTHRESTVSSGPSLPPPMKVLPDIPGRVAKLRPTNNGNILHSGGTISKNNNLQRSKSISSPTYQQHQQQSSFNEAEENGILGNSLPPRMAMMRSKTQFNMMAGGAGTGGRPRDFEDSRRGYATNQRKPSYEHGTLNKKRFGSEPDLRLSMAAELQQEQEAGQHRNSKPVQSKIMKGKNKKKAPVPPAAEKREPEIIEKQQPVLQQQQQRIIAYSPLRKTNSDASSTLPSSDSNSNNPTRKLRLFKTRAETKKNIITKLPEASDAKYQAKPSPASNLKMRVSPTNSNSSPFKPPRKDPDFDTSTLDKPKSRLNPTSFFRREKTFDLGILERDRQQPEVKPTMSPPISRRKSIVKSLLEKDQKEQQQQQQQQLQRQQQQQLEQSRITSVEPKFKPKVQDEKRKPSQTAAPVMTDFQKELAMATRRKTALGGSNPNLAQSTKPSPTAAGQQRKMSEVVKQTIKVEPAPPPVAKNNSLVISVEPPKQDEREKLSISPPPPPPPLPKTSFYFGMTLPKKTTATVEQRISPTLLSKAKMLETRVDSEPEDSSEEEEKRPLESPSDDSEMDKTQLDVIDRFAASLLNGTKFQSGGSDSAASSDVDVRTNSGIELFTEGQEISLKLRPTLPRKNFEIPRFSPAAAWRLLTTEDDFGRDSTELFPFADQKKTMLRSLEAVDAAAEDRIERIYREPIPGLQDNKSGDSGISGDAGLPDIGEAQMMNSSKERDSPESSPVDEGGPGEVVGTNGWSASAIRLTPWTPQQDLEDDDDTTGSSADNRQLIEEGPISGGPNDFSSKGHLFSLSLPRENHLSIYTGTAANGDKVEKHMFNSLQKLRKSVSDAFTSDAELSPLESGDNWFLSRLDSSPAAITNSYEKRQLSPTGPKQSPPEAPSSAGSAGSKKHDDLPKPTKHLPIGYLVSGKHMMYLPKEATKVVTTSGKNDANNNSVPTEPPMASYNASRSGYGAPRKDNKENMQDPVPANGTDNGSGEMEKFPVKISNRKNHRFTFQSTIRQIEKRRVAEKLSREAEIKEAMRLSELEAMRRVEEEFQKKRAREKASIRHQLRLFSMEEGGGQPFDGNEEEEIPELTKRAEPEGDSLPHQPSSTTATSGSKPTNGMFRKKDATLERQTYLNGGGQARRLSQSRFHQTTTTTTTLERKYSSSSNQNQDQDFNGGHEPEHAPSDDDDDVDSSIGYIDTRTPYISRIIQAKSSKSYGLKK